MANSVEIRQSTIVRWDKWLIDQASDAPGIIFFIIFYRIRALETIYFYLYKFIKKKFLQRNMQGIKKKK